MDAEITIDNKISKSYKQVLLITSMIHKFEGGGLKIAPAADPYDGKLSVCMVHGLSRLKILFMLPTLLFGKHTDLKGIETFDCKTLDITLDKPATIHFDGEVPGEIDHLSISCTPKQLRIIK
jgi:diacylglycerol kinase family enzyme